MSISAFVSNSSGGSKRSQYVRSISAGVVVRGQFRALLRELRAAYPGSLSFEEEKGWLSSVFIVTASREAMDEIYAAIERFDRVSS